MTRDAARHVTAAGVWGYRLAPAMAPYDAVITRNGADFALVEIKGRSGDADQYGEWHIAQHKIDACKAEATRLKLRFFIVFSWSGKPYFADSGKLPPLRTHVSGRYDRGDAADVESMYLIPRSCFSAV